jgi:Flp pilus assembly protein TadB
MAKKSKKKQYEEKIQKADLQNKHQDFKSSKQSMRIEQENNGRSRKAEKRAEAKELRDIEDLQLKSSKNTQGEIFGFVRYLAVFSAFTIGATSLGMLLPTISISLVVLLLTLFLLTGGLLITRVVESVKREKK